MSSRAMGLQPLEVRRAEFQKRLLQAADNNISIPRKYGRVAHIQQEFAKRGVEIQLESIRKWFIGASIPRDDKSSMLAEILRVDESWLMLGYDPELMPRERRARNALVDGSVNLLAGMIQMDGGIVAFPDEDDERAEREHISVFAIVKGANYSFHVTSGTSEEDGIRFIFPSSRRNAQTIVIGVVPQGDFAYKIYEVTPEVIEQFGRDRGGSTHVTVPEKDLRRIKSFADRI